jgi:hypothetical protein
MMIKLLHHYVDFIRWRRKIIHTGRFLTGVINFLASRTDRSGNPLKEGLY